MTPHRIAGGGIVLKGDAILLVRYPTAGGGSYLVGPGGALRPYENTVDAIIRETREETDVVVRPWRVLWIEDLQCVRFKMCKIWMLCDVVGGDVMPTEEARAEGIVEAGWFTREDLRHETVFPTPVMEHQWDEFRAENWEARCLESRDAAF
ncbi:NUDIX hydrolase [Candidatus Fermentibacteria bacterium]|nr:NUDIX hydrolase [Candidatus Fermentibacteria bacterium]